MPRKKKPVVKKRSYSISINADFDAKDRKEAGELALDAARKLPREMFRAGVHLELWAEYGDSPLWTTEMI
jgi:hypothetical protein